MGRVGFIVVSAGAMILSLAGSFTARGQDSVSGVVNAMSFHPVPEGLPILVRPLDDSPENLSIKADLEKALTLAGFPVAKENSSVVLSFETRRELGGGPTPERQITTEFSKRHEDSVVGDERYRPQIGKGPKQGPTSISASRFRLDATLDDKQSGKRLWQGWAIARMQGEETGSLARAMAPALAESLGNTVREQIFEIPISASSESRSR